MDEQETDLQNPLKECEKIRDEYLAGWQRARADFLNYQKQEQDKLIWLRQQIDKDWLLRILDFFDDLERAREHLPQELAENDWVKANFAIYDKFLDELKKQGLEEIKSIGEKFNPEVHEAVSEVEGEGEAGIIKEVLQKGYMLNGELLRAVKVKIVK